MTRIDAKADAFLSLKRIAVAGVSRKKNDAANGIYRKLKKSGYDVFPVNPNAEEFDGSPCYPDLQSIPGGVEGAVIVTRPDITKEIVRDCAEAGVGKVWMHRSLESLGNSVSEEAVAFCRDRGIEVIAGACPMMFCKPVDLGHKCIRGWLRLTGKMPA